MITKVVLYLGGYALAPELQRFCLRNRNLLNKSNVIAPELFPEQLPESGLFCGCEILDGIFNTITPVDNSYCHLNESLLLNIKRTYAGQSANHTLCLFWPCFFLRAEGYLEAALKVVSIIKAIFSGAEIVPFFIFTRQDLEREATLNVKTIQGLHFGSIRRESCVVNIFRNSYTAYLYFHTNYPQGRHVALVNTGTEKFNHHAIESFAQCLGLHGQSALHDNIEPPVPDLLPRDLLEFMSVLNGAFRTLGREVPFSWFEQTEFLQSGKEVTALYSPEQRLHITKQHAQDNNKLFALLNVKYAFPEPASEDGWEHSPGLSEEHAGFLAARLTPKALEMVAQCLESIPGEHLTAPLLMLYEGVSAVRAQRPTAPVIKKRSNVKVAVLTATYNHIKYIKRNIEAVLEQQTDFPIAHIIADDGSDDGTQDVIREYAAKYPHIIPLLKSSREAFWEGETFCRLFEMARTPYVSLCEGDDFFCHPLKLQRQVDFLDSTPDCSICFHPAYMIWEGRNKGHIFPSGKELPPHRPPYNLIDLIRWNFIPTSSVMYRWRFTEGVPHWFFIHAMPGDWYWHTLHAEIGKVGMLPEPMSVYWRHEAGAWSLADTDHVKHRQKFGLCELTTYVAMDRHFKGKYKELFKPHIIAEFSILDLMAINGDNTKLFALATQVFPEWVQYICELPQES